MLRVENVATPLTAAIPLVPDNDPPPGFVPIATVCSALVGCTVNTSWLAAPGVTVTVAVGVIVMPLITAVTVFVSATVELKVPVATPLALVGPVGWVRVFPVPVADSTTVAPLTAVPEASSAASVIVP